MRYWIVVIALFGGYMVLAMDDWQDDWGLTELLAGKEPFEDCVTFITKPQCVSFYYLVRASTKFPGFITFRATTPQEVLESYLSYKRSQEPKSESPPVVSPANQRYLEREKQKIYSLIASSFKEALAKYKRE